MSHRLGADVSPATRRMLAGVTAALGVATFVGIIALRPTGAARPDLSQIGITSEIYAGVERAAEGPCQGSAPSEGIRCSLVTARLLEGPDEGERVTLGFSIGGASPLGLVASVPITTWLAARVVRAGP